MNKQRENLITLGLATAIGIYFICFLWNFWSHGYTVLGIGATVLGLMIMSFYIFSQRATFTTKAFLWIIPLILIILSLGIYTNPFTKVINILVLPILYLIFTTHESHKRTRESLWSKLFIPEAVIATLRLLSSCFASIPEISKLSQRASAAGPQKELQPEQVPQIKRKSYSSTQQILIGLIIFAILAITLVIPLLSSADPRFATLFEDLTKWFVSFLSVEGLVKVLFVILITILFFGYKLYWQKDHLPFVTKSEKSDTRAYSPMIGTILIGLLGLYGLFLFLQAQNLFASTLPVDFKVTETLVKSGFWQLLVLTALNTVLYTTIFGKTMRWAQYILGAFTIASLLLLFSAVQRVYLYVTVYGLSYEKFFAFYTVLFCVGMFLWFIYLMITKKKEMPIFKALCFSALWFYAVATVFPVERFVLTTNLAMTKDENSRIDLSELQMLSFDAVRTFDNKKQEIIDESEKDKLKAIELLREQEPGIYLSKQNENITFQWNQWREEQIEQKNLLTCYYCRDTKETKKWHEKTFSELLYKKSNRKNQINKNLSTWKDPYNGYEVSYDAGKFHVPYTNAELYNQNSLEAYFLQDSPYINALSVERYYFDDFDTSKLVNKYRIRNNTQEFKNVDSYKNFVSKSSGFVLGNTIAHPGLYRSTQSDELVIALYLEAPNGYFILSPTRIETSKVLINQETPMPESLGQYIEVNGFSDSFAAMLKSFKLIKQDLQ